MSNCYMLEKVPGALGLLSTYWGSGPAQALQPQPMRPGAWMTHGESPRLQRPPGREPTRAQTST